VSITYISANAVLNKCFGNTTLTQPSTYYVGLSTTPPNIDGTTGYTEPSGGSYARVAVTNSDKTNWAVATSGALTNATAVTFPESSGAWGTITHVFLADASTAGNVWWWDALSPSRVVATATTVQFAIGAITVQMTNA
jgi:hypothetical protein